MFPGRRSRRLCRQAQPSRKGWWPNRRRSRAPSSLPTVISVKATSQTAFTWTTATCSPARAGCRSAPATSTGTPRTTCSSTRRRRSRYNSYRMAQARIEAPKFLKSRLGLGAQARWQDFGRVDYFDVGPATSVDDLSIYGIESTQLTAYATLRPFRWMDIGGQIGWMNPVTNYHRGSVPVAAGEPARSSCRWKCRRRSTRATSPDTRPAASCCAASARATRIGPAARRASTRLKAKRPASCRLGGGRVVLALHGWYVGTEARSSGGTVPFYLQPSLGGLNTLRGFTDYRFHDDHMLVANAEMRLALMTHLDFAVFADAGNVAPRRGNLNLDKRSYGAGFRLHTRRETFAMLDMAKGDEGWRFLFRLKDPLSLGASQQASHARAVRAVARSDDDDPRCPHRHRRADRDPWRRRLCRRESSKGADHAGAAGARACGSRRRTLPSAISTSDHGDRNTRRIRTASTPSSSGSTPASISA